MKTTSYNTEKEIRLAILFVLFTIAIFTTIKVKELQLNEISNEEITGSGQMMINQVNYLSLPVLDARLVEEPALEIESWMTSNTYFIGANTEEAVEAEPALEIESWMTSNTYFIGANTEEAVEAEPALEIESWMMHEAVLNNQQPAIDLIETIEDESLLAIESWMNIGAYWTGSEEQITSGNEKANN